MNEPHIYRIKTGSNADIAFAIVVLTSYFATFTTLRKVAFIDLVLILLLGVAYIAFGIY